MANDANLERKLVAAGLIVDELERVLLTQRPPGGPLPLEWELPGGKVEPGESPVEALHRELDEEIALAVDVFPIWEVLYHRYPDFELVMLVYPVRPRAGSRPQRRQVANIAWLHLAELAEHPILPADRPLIERLVAEGLPPFRGALD